MKIAIIDDAQMNLTELQYMVSKLPDCESVCFTDPVAALEWCLANEPDLVIVDYMMPILSGTELVERFRARHPSVPVLMITASHETTLLYEALKIGVTDFLTKPLDHIEFLVRTKNMLALRASHKKLANHAAQLQVANQEMEAFSYSVSHDLRTPLSAIDGFSNLLGRELGANAASERSQHYLSCIRAGVAQMGELIDALLSLAQVSRASLRWGSVDLSVMADAVVNGYREREPGRVALLDIQFGLVAQGDARLLQQVLDNLLGNAWKFSSKQLQSLISFGLQSGPDGEPVYAVKDNGVGFDMAYSENLFGAFQRLHTAAEFPGTGIGLATVHRIITRHGGKVWAESSPGQGSTFYFTLGSDASTL